VADPIIQVQHVCKTYRTLGPRAWLLRSLGTWFGTPERAVQALQDVSFEVAPGTVFGVIGGNGSGKSTLLAILAGVVRPTSGRVCVAGPVSALLELGAGFHPDFTGRENVRMFGALAGLSPRTIERRLPDIVDFAGIGDFLDRPVRTYSSGMFVRLAFSAAIHVDPAVLLVDEALAVGDIEFQHKCLHRIREMRRGGATIVYVSHDIEGVRALASQVLLLDHGRVLDLGEPNRVCDSYYRLLAERAASESRPAPRQLGAADPATLRPCRDDRFFVDPELDTRAGEIRYGSGEARVRGIQILDELDRMVESVPFNARVTVRVSVECLRDFPYSGGVGIVFRDRHGFALSGANSHGVGVPFGPRIAGDQVVVDFRLRLPFSAFSYSIGAEVTTDPEQFVYADRLENGLVFHVTAPPPPLRLLWPVYLHPEIGVSPPPRRAVGAGARAPDHSVACEPLADEPFASEWG